MAMDTAALTFVARLEDDASAAARGLRGTMDALGGPVDPITAAVVMEAEGLARTQAQVEGVNDDIVQDSAASGDKAGRELGEGISGGIEKASAGMEKAAGLAGLAIAGAVVGAVSSAMDLEDANAKLTAQLGLNEADAGRLGAAAGEVYADNWGESMGDVNTAVAAVYSSIDGMSDAGQDDIEALTVKALAFADTFDTDVTRATQVVGQAIRTGLVKDADEGFDLLTKASQQVPAGVREDLLDAVDEYAPFFQSLGMSGEDAFGALAAGADKGMYGIDKTGDALKEFTIRATDMSSTTQAALGSIQGIDVASIDKNSKEGKATLARLAKSSQDLSNDFLAGGKTAKGAFQDTVKGLLAIEDPAQRSQAALALFGTPLEDLSVSEIPGFLSGLVDGSKKMTGFEGSAQKVADTVGGTTSGAFKAIKRDLEQTAAAWGAKLLPMVQQFLPVIKALAPVILILVGAFVVLNGILKAVAITQALLNSTLLANPITWLVIGIAALVAALVLFFTKTELGRKIISAAWAGIKAAINGVVRWWTRTAWPAVKAVISAMGAFFGKLKGWITTAWSGIRNAIKTAVSAIATVIRTYVNVWKAIITGVVKGVAAVIRTYVNIWKAVIRGAVSGIKTVLEWFGKLPGLFRKWFAAAVTAIKRKVSDIVAAVRGMVTKVSDKAAELLGLFKTIGGNIVQGVVNGITGSVHKVVDAARSIVDNIAGPVKKLLGIHSPSKVFEGFGKNVVEGFTKGLDDNRDKAAASVSALVAKIKDVKGLGRGDKTHLISYVKFQGKALDTAWKAYDHAASKLAAANEKLKGLKAERTEMRKSIASSVMGTVDLGSLVKKDDDGNVIKGGTTFKSVSTYVKGLVGKFRTFARSLKSLRKAGLPAGLIQMVAGLGPDEGTEVAKALLGGSKGEIAQLKDDWSALDDWSNRAGSAVAHATYDTGIAAQEGLVKGLTSDTKKAKKAAQTLAHNLARWIRKELGIHSPSRVFRDIGDQTVAGLALGLEDTAPVESAMAGLTDTVTGGLNVNPIGVQGNVSTAVRVQIDHVVTSPDGSVRQYTAQQLADMLAREPGARATLEGAVRKAAQSRQARTISAS